MSSTILIIFTSKIKGIGDRKNYISKPKTCWLADTCFWCSHRSPPPQPANST